MLGRICGWVCSPWDPGMDAYDAGLRGCWCDDHEGMSNVLLEAAATGRPVLATNIPGCKEAVEDNMTGLLFASRSAEALESVIEYFLSLSVESREAMGRAARTKMEQEFNRKHVVESYIEEIDRAV